MFQLQTSTSMRADFGVLISMANRQRQCPSMPLVYAGNSFFLGDEMSTPKETDPDLPENGENHAGHFLNSKGQFYKA